MRFATALIGLFAATHASTPNDPFLTQQKCLKHGKGTKPVDSAAAQSDTPTPFRPTSITNVLHGKTLPEITSLEKHLAIKSDVSHTVGADIADSNGKNEHDIIDNITIISRAESDIPEWQMNRDTDLIDGNSDAIAMQTERLDRDEDIAINLHLSNSTHTLQDLFDTSLAALVHEFRQLSLYSRQQNYLIMQIYYRIMFEISPLMTLDTVLRILFAYGMYSRDMGEAGLYMALFFSLLSNAIVALILLSIPYVPANMHTEWNTAAIILFSASIVYSVVRSTFQFILRDDALRMCSFLAIVIVFEGVTSIASIALLDVFLKNYNIQFLVANQSWITAIPLLVLQPIFTQLSNDFSEIIVDTYKSLIAKMNFSQRIAIIALCERPETIPMDDSIVCSVCHMPLHDLSEDVVMLPCKHMFHNSCICKWAQMFNGNICPMCRQMYCKNVF